MSHVHDKAELVETALEQRDGGIWVTGQCSCCFARVGVRVSDSSPPGPVECPFGHHLHVPDLRSARKPRPREASFTDVAALRGERDELHHDSPGWSPEGAPKPSPKTGMSQPDESTWPSKHPTIGPPQEGQPRAGSAGSAGSH